MSFTVRDWMVDLIVFVDPDATVTEALKLMRRRYIHSLIVSKSAAHPEYGIVTSTDISDKIIADERDPNRTRVREIMSSPVLTVSADLSLKACAELMRQKRIHHLPVSDETGEIIGMISATDFLVAAEAMGR